ncbi:phosphotransferase family protein [Ferrimonas balearica]|uniref:phosphotransferase family protein n=1 Tax=Ferrimonas balearica TaxID=44012 RepID=UPI001C99FF86|nr:phosphotransferase [Ferrimonas balearica]MBY5991266.1 phosphotransferase [Ferrimonas balearica]
MTPTGASAVPEGLNAACERLEALGYRWQRREALDGGLGNRLWRLDGEGQSLVLRLHNQALAFCVDRAQEARAWRAVQALGRAPALLHWETAFSLSAWGGTAPEALEATPLLDLMAVLHALPGHWTPVRPEVRIQAYLSGLSHSQCTPWLEHLPPWRQALSGSALPEGFIHGDLHRGNLLVGEGGHYLALDFEYAGQASPLMDLAPILTESDPEWGRALWQGYLARRGVSADDGEWAAMRGAACLYLLMSAAWAERMERLHGDVIYSQWLKHYLDSIGEWNRDR